MPKERYGHFYGDSLRVECPTGSGTWMTLQEVADELSARLARLFARAQEAGDVAAALDPQLLAQTATILVDGIAVQALRTSAKLTPAKQKAVVDTWLAGLR